MTPSSQTAAFNLFAQYVGQENKGFPTHTLECHDNEIDGNVLSLMLTLLPTFSWGHQMEGREHGRWPRVGSDFNTKNLIKFPPRLICCKLTGSSCEQAGCFLAQRENRLDNLEGSTLQLANYLVHVWVRNCSSEYQLQHSPSSERKSSTARALQPNSCRAQVCWSSTTACQIYWIVIIARKS